MVISRRSVLALPAGIAAAACGDTSAPPSARSHEVPWVRQVSLVVPGQATRDGAGVRLSRTLGSRLLPMLDPFLMLDAFRSSDPNDYIRGFPNHPHRGFETVTYMLRGLMEHKDSMGNQGLLRPGSVQWMTAGRGIIHSEMPRQEQGEMSGFQLWVNLPASLKMTAPRYQDLQPAAIPEVSLQGSQVRIVAGDCQGQSGPVSGIAVAPLMLDVTLRAGDRFEHPVVVTHNAFVQVVEGQLRLADQTSPLVAGSLAVLGPGDGVAALATEAGARFLLLSGQPIGEPVARRGPFVMNTEAELDQAYADYQAGTLTG